MDLEKRLNEMTTENKTVVNTIIEGTIELWDIIEIVGLYRTIYLCYLTRLTISL